MRDINRLEPTLNKILEVWKKYPDLRLGQLLLNCMSEMQLYYMEEEDIITTLERHYVNVKYCNQDCATCDYCEVENG